MRHLLVAFSVLCTLGCSSQVDFSNGDCFEVWTVQFELGDSTLISDQKDDINSFLEQHSSTIQELDNSYKSSSYTPYISVRVFRNDEESSDIPYHRLQAINNYLVSILKSNERIIFEIDNEEMGDVAFINKSFEGSNRIYGASICSRLVNNR